MVFSCEHKTISKLAPMILVGVVAMALGFCVYWSLFAPVTLANAAQSGLVAGSTPDSDDQVTQDDQADSSDQTNQDGQTSWEAVSVSADSNSRLTKIGLQSVAVKQPGARATATQLFSYGWSDGEYHAKTVGVFSGHDVTGDGVGDRLAISLAPLESNTSGLIGSVSLAINGQDAYQLVAASTGIDKVTLTLLRLVNDQAALFLSAYDADGAALQAVLNYTGGSLAKVVGNDLLDLVGVSNAHITSVIPSGNRIIVQFDFVSSVTGVSRTSFTYLGTGQAFAREGNKTSALRYATTEVGAFTKQPRKAASSFGVYADASLSSVAFTVPEGEKVRPLAVRLSGNRLLYKVKYGELTGWIASPDPDFIKGGKLLRSAYGKVSLSTKLPEYSENGALGLSLLQKLSNHALYLARNEIYARHGYVFEDQELASYFASQSWYSPNVEALTELSTIESKKLTAIETKNIALMLMIEKNRMSPYVS